MRVLGTIAILLLLTIPMYTVLDAVAQPKLTPAQQAQIEAQRKMIEQKGKAPAVPVARGIGPTAQELFDEIKALRADIVELRRELKRK